MEMKYNFLCVTMTIKHNFLSCLDSVVVGREREVGVGMSRFSVYRKSRKTTVAFLICASLHDNTVVARYDVIPAL